MTGERAVEMVYASVEKEISSSAEAAKVGGVETVSDRSKRLREAQAVEAEARRPAGAAKRAARLPAKLRLTENSLRVLKSRYLKKGPGGKLLETPEELFQRVARTAAIAEADYGAKSEAIAEVAADFYDVMASGRFMPNSPTLMNAGREMGMLSACFVLPVGDSIDEIFDTVKATALIQKAGGGTGFSFDRLRPTGDFIRSSGGTTSGPISFWKVLSEATNAIQQGAFRRGANMGMMSVTHPDILKFIEAKQDLNHFTNYNISVKIPDEWMKARREDAAAAHVVTNPRTDRKYVIPKDLEISQYQISDLLPLEEFEALPAGKRPRVWTRGELYDLIVDHAWQTGEPGVAFINRINEGNTTPHLGEMEATNPCGEQPLLPYEACNLGSVNLGAFAGRDEQGEPSYDWEGLRTTVRTAVRFLDNVIDVNNYPLPEIAEICRANRKIGLGVMGFADALFVLGVRYDSEDGVEWGERLMKFVNDEAHAMSEELAGTRGVFPNWAGSTWDVKQGRKMRNACTTTVAPTGTISIISGCSGGVEPMFSVAFYRNVLEGQRLVEAHPYFEETAKKRGFYSKELMDRIADIGTLRDLNEVPDDVKNVFVCAHDIAPEWHVRMQAAFQKHCDSAISKTTNLPHTADSSEVRTIYELAFDLGCKGVTIYRDGCRKGQPMALKKEEKKKGEETGGKHGLGRPVNTPSILSAVRIRQRTPFGHMHVTITVDPKSERELEVFAQLGKAGDVAMSDLEAICRMVSLFLRSGGSLIQVIDQLEGIGSSLSIPTKEGRVMSLGDALGKTLRRYWAAKSVLGLKPILLGEVNINDLPENGRGGNGAGPATTTTTATATVTPGKRSKTDHLLTAFKVKCPECEGRLTFVEGCVKCQVCGFSQC